MLTVACVLRSGGEYGPEHVAWLRDQVSTYGGSLVCYSDVDVPCECVALTHGWPGWYSKFEICRPDVPGDVLFLDLDTVLVGPLAPLVGVGRTTGLRDFYREGNSFQSSVMYLTEADRSRLWQAWIAQPIGWMNEARNRGDQYVIERVIGATALRWQDVLPNYFASYKNDIARLKLAAPPPGVGVVVFHGKPRPWEVAASWIPPLRLEKAA